MKVVMTILGVIIIILMFGVMLNGINNAQTDTRTDSFSVTTAPGVTTGDVVLVTLLYGADINNVVSITSDVGTDVPLPDTYVAGTRTLTVRGLTADDTRTLNVEYKYDALTGDAAPVSTFFGFTPMLIIIAVILVIVGAMVAVFSRR